MSESEVSEVEEATDGIVIDGDVEETAEPEAPPKPPEGYVSIEDNTHQVNKQHKKYRDEERARVAAEKKAADLEAELKELKLKSVDMTIPPIPDQYDPDYEAKIQARDEKIKAVAAHEVSVSSLESQQKDHELEAKNSQIEAKNAKVAGFDSNMVTLGLNPIELKKAADTVVDYGISETLEDAVLEDPEGPLMVQYLANNPLRLEEINRMTPFQAYKALEEIRPQAQLLKPRTSQTPEPPEILSGGGAGEIEHPSLKGVTFE